MTANSIISGFEATTRPRPSYTVSLENEYQHIVLRSAWLLLIARYAGADTLDCADIASSNVSVMHTEHDIEISDFIDKVKTSIAGDACSTVSAITDFPLAERHLGSETINFTTAFYFESSSLDQLDLYHIAVLATSQSVTISMDARLSSHDHDAALPKRLAGQLQAVAAQIHSPQPNSTLATVDFMSGVDWEDAAQHELPYPELEPDTLLALMTRNSLPASRAIDAWDGALTYAELDRASSILADKLTAAGVRRGNFVPIFFEKSKWHPVCMFACSKARAAWVTVSVDMPPGRVERIINQLNEEQGSTIQVCLSSVRERGRAASFVPNVLQVDAEMLHEAFESNGTSHNGQIHNEVEEGTTTPNILEPNDCAYVVFTSGTTGRPKGIPISHANACSLNRAFARLGGNKGGPEVRHSCILSYAFDVSLLEALVSLCTGSCLCIPSEEERINDLGPALARYGVTHLHVTPSLSEILDPAELPSVKSIHFVGERITTGLVQKWLPRTDVLLAYGPAEITNECAALQPSEDSNFGNGCIGRPFNSRVYIINPNNPHRRLPRGFVGEIIIEGPGVSKGYLGEPILTAHSFIQELAWAPAVDGNPRRFYRTGDLGYLDANGLFYCRGRSDLQVKIRGQRIELLEVEAGIADLLPNGSRVIADVATPKEGIEVLVAFIHVDPTLYTSWDELVKNIKERLPETLPSAFLPSSFIRVDHIPLGPTGKADRRTLKEAVERLSIAELLHSGVVTVKSVPDRDQIKVVATGDNAVTDLSHNEVNALEALRDIWVSVLPCDGSQVVPDANFFTLGGDSLLAMKIVALAHRKSFNLSVVDIFKHPTLRELIQISKSSTEKELNVTRSQPTKTLLSSNNVNGSVDKSQPHLNGEASDTSEGLSYKANATNGPGHAPSIHEIATSWHVHVESIEEISPATWVQENIIAQSEMRDWVNILQWKFEIPKQASLPHLRDAWLRIHDRNPILRTRLFQSQHGLFQVVLADNLHWEVLHEAYSVEAQSRRLQSLTIADGHLSDLIVFEPPTGEAKTLVWTVHHALIDGHSAELILDSVKKAYQGHAVPRLEPFIPYSRWLVKEASQLANQDYQRAFEDYEGMHFPVLPYADYIPRTNAILNQCVPRSATQLGWYNESLLLRAAWSLALARITDSDVVFGFVLHGRNNTKSENVVGPLSSIAPVRIKIDRSLPVVRFLQQVEDEMVATASFGETPFSHIHSPGLELACRLQNILDIHISTRNSETEGSDENNWLKLGHSTQDSLKALAIRCFVQPEEIQLVAQYDNNVIEKLLVKEALARFAKIIEMIQSASSDVSVQDILANSENVNTLSADTLKKRLQKFLPEQGTCAVASIAPEGLREMLVAFIDFGMPMTSSSFDTECAQLRNYLKDEIPAQMVPAAFYPMPKSPEAADAALATSSSKGSQPPSILEQLQVDSSSIEDITGVTPFQKAHIEFALQTPGFGSTCRLYVVPPEVDVEQLVKAWDMASAALPCLRTRFVLDPQDGSPKLVTLTTWQKLEIVHFADSAAATSYINTLRIEAGTKGSALARAALVHVEGEHLPTFVFALNHIVYDGMSAELVWQTLCDAYGSGHVTQSQLPYRRWMDHLATQDKVAARSFWQNYLKGASPTAFPINPKPDHITRIAGREVLMVPLLNRRGSVFTMATLVRAAWALTISSFTGSKDILILDLLSGRTMSFPGVENMPGPTLNFVPMRIRVEDESMTVTDFLNCVQNDSADILQHEFQGFDAITEIDLKAPSPYGFNSSLIINPAPKEPDSQLPLQLKGMEMDYTGYVALVIRCWLSPHGLLAEILHDPVVLNATETQEILSRFRDLISGLAEGEKVPDSTLGGLLALS